MALKATTVEVQVLSRTRREAEGSSPFTSIIMGVYLSGRGPRFVLVTQLAEVPRSNRGCWGFDSLRGHVQYTTAMEAAEHAYAIAASITNDLNKQNAGRDIPTDLIIRQAELAIHTGQLAIRIAEVRRAHG